LDLDQEEQHKLEKVIEEACSTKSGEIGETQLRELATLYSSLPVLKQKSTGNINLSDIARLLEKDSTF